MPNKNCLQTYSRAAQADGHAAAALITEATTGRLVKATGRKTCFNSSIYNFVQVFAVFCPFPYYQA
jgi:hypothetical protein